MIWMPAILLGICFLFYQNQSIASGPCTAFEYDFGGGSNLVPCGPAANTESGVNIENTGANTGPLNGSCGPVGNGGSPTDVLWVAFTVQAGGSFEWQAVPGADDFKWELYYSNNTGGPNECIDLTYVECGDGFTGWKVQMSPSIISSTKFYLAVYLTDGDMKGDAVLKFRKACGEDGPCTLMQAAPEMAVCGPAGSYTLTIAVSGSNGTYMGTDVGATSITTMPSPLEFTNGAGGVFNGTITAIYPAGTNYNLTVTSSTAGCMEMINVAGIAPNCCNLTAMATGIDATCFGGNDGSIAITPMNGTGPYTWTATGGLTGGGLTVPNLTTGNYVVTLTDANGCIAITNAVTIGEPTFMDAQCARLNDVSCFGGNDGIVQVTAVGGTPPYMYQWAANAGGSTNTMVSNLPAGIYTVTVVDANGCQDICAAQVNQPAAPVDANCARDQDASCFGASDGQISVSALDGTPPYMYQWSANAGGSTNQVVGGLPAGVYTATVTDANGCTNSCAAQVNQPMPSITCPNPLTLACNAPNLMNQVNSWLLTGATFDPCLMNISVTNDYNAANFMGCGNSGSQMVTFSLRNTGGAVIASCMETLTINAPALPVITCPVLAPIACTGIGGFTPSPLTGMGDCGTTWNATAGPVSQNLQCDGSGTLNWTYTGTDDCGRMLVPVSCSVVVMAAPPATVTCPALPAIGCEQVANYVPPMATVNGVCGVGGNMMGGLVVSTNYTACAGGTITVRYEGNDACGRPIVPQECDVMVNPAPLPTVMVPNIPSTMSCDASGAFNVPDATYMGPCGISGTLSPTITGMYNPCTGTNFSVTWNGMDECGRPLTAGPVSYFVEAAPAPTLTIPMLPTSLTCDEADAFMAMDATYNNNAVAPFCNINGTLPAMVTPNWDKCNGGTITVRYMGNSTACNHLLDSGPIVIPVAAAPTPMITMPNLPPSLSCADAATYVAPNATFTNNGMGGCLIDGFIFPSQTNSFSACGGKITISYMITTSGSDCSYLLQGGTYEIMVDPAPPATVNAPPMPTSLTCIQADNFAIGSAAYTNGIVGGCNISGNIAPTIDHSGWTKCGGILKVTYLTTDQCNNILTAGPFDIPVLPAPEATVTPPPAFPTNITCFFATGFVAPSVDYDNGINGTCNISGTIQPSIANNFDKCGGNITITYSTTDMCNRTVSLPPYIIYVDPAPEATVSLPWIPTTVSCEDAVGFMALPATYTNGLTGTPCEITGSFLPLVENTYDKCGGTIKLTYISTDMCNRPLNGGIITITVEPAPEANTGSIILPAILPCNLATSFIAPGLPYTNGLMGACEISGIVPPTVVPDFDKCGGNITITYNGFDMCNRPITAGPFVIPVEPAPTAIVTMPVLPTSVSCEMATTYMAPDAPYTNGLMGACEISGTIPGFVNPNFDKCGGTLTIVWTGQDMCGRPLTLGPKVITVDPAPAATIMQPNIPTNLSCENAVGYMAPDAPYSNGLTGACEISGTVTGVVTPNFDKCGGNISITYNGADECGRTIIAATFMITVDPAPAATITQPVLPTSLSCADADGYSPPVAPYSNAITGICEISGTVTGVVTNNFTACGGTIMVTYSGVDECGRTIISASYNITVDPAPEAPVAVPFVPTSLSCVDATTYGAPVASYNNGLTGVCNISGMINPVMTPNFDACGGTIVITYNSQDACGRTLSASRTITVNPAPTATLTVPTFPSSITCEASQTFLEEYASYDNGLTGVCNISGWIQPVVNKVVDACNGGYITLTYNGFDVCGNYLSAPTVYVNVEPAPPAVLTIPETPMMLQCWEAGNYSPGYATYTNGLSGTCENSGTIYPTLMQLWDDRCEGGFIIISYDGYDDCGNHLSYPAYKIPILPDAIAPIGECTEIEESFQFMYQTPGPDELGDYKYQIASNYWDYCSAIVVTVVGDTGEPVCGLDGKYERVYDMEVADECGNVADTCTVRFYGNCNPEYCTLSQSFYAGEWGEDWGQDSLFGFSSIEIIDSLLGYGEDSIKIGTGTCGFYLDDPYCIQQILKGTGTSYFLWDDYNLDCGDSLDNNLINQTIVTILNVRYNELFNGLDFGNYQLSATCKNYPHHMLEYMPDNPTVNDLIDYANNFIGCPCSGTCGDFETTPIAWDITCAFLALNSRFHECHIPGPCHLDNQDIYDYATQQMLDDKAAATAATFNDNAYNLNIGEVTLPDVIDFFPNPANQVLNVRLTTNNANTYRIRVLSTNGAEVLSREVEMVKGENTTQLNIEQLDRGIYLLFIEGNDTQWSERFVKMKK